MATVRSLYTAALPDIKSFPEYILNRVQEHGAKIALIEASTDRQYTFAEIHALVRRLASALRRRGVKRGHVVCICSTNCVDYIIIILAVTSLGAILTTASHHNTIDELAKQFADSKTHFVFTDEHAAQKVSAASRKYGAVKEQFVFGTAAGMTSLRTLYRDDGDLFHFSPVTDPLNDVMTLLYSSGTTGVPKGVLGTHANYLAVVSSICTQAVPIFSNPASETALLSLPMSHVFALTWSMIFLYCGYPTVILPKFDLDLCLESIQKFKVTTLLLVPPIVNMLIKENRPSIFSISSLRNIFSGGAPLASEISNAFLQRFGAYIRPGFGMSETTGGVTHTMANSIKIGSTGQLLPGWEAKIVDSETGAVKDINEEGEVYVRGPARVKGYLNNVKVTQETFDNEGWLHTGDIGYFDADGHMFITGRLKELIKCNAYQVAPAELEAILMKHTAIVDAAVIGVPHPEFGEVPKAFVVKRDDAKDVSESEIAKFVNDQVSSFKRLRGGVTFITEIPKLPSGKILRMKLKSMDQSSAINSMSKVASKL